MAAWRCLDIWSHQHIFLRLIFSVFSLVLVSIEEIYQTQNTVYSISKHLEVRQQYNTPLRVVFSTFFSVFVFRVWYISWSHSYFVKVIILPVEPWKMNFMAPLFMITPFPFRLSSLISSNYSLPNFWMFADVTLFSFLPGIFPEELLRCCCDSSSYAATWNGLFDFRDLTLSTDALGQKTHAIKYLHTLK